jgi:hypothetical protein
MHLSAFSWPLTVPSRQGIVAGQSRTGHGPCARRTAIIVVVNVLHLHEMLRCFRPI